MPYRQANQELAVPVMSLKKQVKGKNNKAVGAMRYLDEKKVFTTGQLIEHMKYIKDMNTRTYRLTRQDSYRWFINLS